MKYIFLKCIWGIPTDNPSLAVNILNATLRPILPRQTDRETERETERVRERVRLREREKKRHREREREIERVKQTLSLKARLMSINQSFRRTVERDKERDKEDLHFCDKTAPGRERERERERESKANTKLKSTSNVHKPILQEDPTYHEYSPWIVSNLIRNTPGNPNPEAK